MLDKIAQAYKTMVSKPKKAPKNDYPILMDGKTFDDEKSERANDPPEKSLEDVIKQLKETFDVPPKEGIEHTLNKLTSESYDFGREKPVHPEVHALHSVFKDVVKNGVNYDKMNTLSDMIHSSNLSTSHKYALGGIWSKAIQNHFGKEQQDVDFKEETPKTKDEMLEHASKHPEVRMVNQNKGVYLGRTLHGHTMNVSIGFDRHGTPHVLSDMNYTPSESIHNDNHTSEEAEHLASSHKQYFKDVSDEAPKHHDEDAYDRIDKVRSLVRYTADFSGPINRYLIHKHNDDVDSLESTMRGSDHRIEPTHETYMKHVDNISHVINNAPAIEKPISVFSGLSGKSGINAYAQKHRQTSNDRMVFHMPAFTSTSTKFAIGTAFCKDAPIHPDEEKMYSDHSGRKDVQDLLHIKLPAGFKGGAFVEHVTENSGEHEYVLDKGTNVSVHPEPKYIFKGRSLYRIWEAHPHKEEE